MKFSFSFLLISLIIKNAFGQITFQESFESSVLSEALAVKQTTDGGYICAGRTYSVATLSEDYFLIKLDSIGDTLWTRFYGGTWTDQAQDIIQTNDGGYLIIGGSYYTLLIKTDSVGDTLWTRNFGGTVVSFSLIQTFDSNYVFVSSENYSGALICKLNNSGDTLWTKLIDYLPNTFATCIIQTSDSGFAIAGSCEGVTPNDEDVYLLKTDSSGKPQWAKAYSTTNQERGYSLIQNAEGDFIIQASNDSAGFPRINVIKTDKNGNLFWSKTYNGMNQEWPGNIILTEDSNYIITGRIYNSSSCDIYFIKINQSGNVVWKKAFGSNDYEFGGYGQLAKDGGFILVGCAYSFTPVSPCVYIVKTDSSGTSGCYENIPVIIKKETSTIMRTLTPQAIADFIPLESQNITVSREGFVFTRLCNSVLNSNEIKNNFNPSIYPNPIKNKLAISLNEFADNASIVIYNSLGQSVYKRVFCGDKLNIDFPFNPGLYILQVDNGISRFTQKIIKN